jgi:hypothetical protein
MQEVEQWLAKLGMSEYAERFAEDRIDFTVLPDLTDHDLKDIGVVLGDRRKILRAIARLPRLRQWFWIPSHRPRSRLQRYRVYRSRLSRTSGGM